ncbi:MAG: hypothetical protein KGI50_00740 [Patescibacteria group bacterium]|nr:hypothetical protein [Patescibacteria group bacterium]
MEYHDLYSVLYVLELDVTHEELRNVSDECLPLWYAVCRRFNQINEEVAGLLARIYGKAPSNEIQEVVNSVHRIVREVVEGDQKLARDIAALKKKFRKELQRTLQLFYQIKKDETHPHKFAVRIFFKLENVESITDTPAKNFDANMHNYFKRRQRKQKHKVIYPKNNDQTSSPET